MITLVHPERPHEDAGYFHDSLKEMIYEELATEAHSYISAVEPFEATFQLPMTSADIAIAPLIEAVALVENLYEQSP